MNIRPALCRERLREEGKPYPRSSCQACGWTVFSGPVERAKCEDSMPQQPPIISDGRPSGWTEARALAFCATLHGPSDAQEFARMFTHGEWRKVMQEFPDFIEWIAKQ